ncbi:dihydrolipoyl dehydrogenase family protein [Haloferula sp. A504]|uniref:dihydrolipoyl dehydrogenase family protein n=1 Tax=Haloferula sp. A504 TaxID=3373601 RepID=UPI0031CC17BE|nr:NAD(P)/FAD-dependent oxidoreductase [Verrucomicrobiaceae bacterium E54]
MSEQKHDAMVVGSGTSAYFAASGLKEGGLDVAIIDERPYGGTCALRGCQPKKYLVCNAEAVAMAQHLVGRGIVEAPRTDWKALQALKNEFLEGRPEGEVEDWRKEGVATYHDRARFCGERSLQVGDRVLTADHIILATGATPRCAGYPGAELSGISDDFLELPELPERLVFVGGGYISFEFAHVAARAGAKEVTILQRSDRVLKGFDADMVEVVVKASEDAGIRVILNESPEQLEKSGDVFLLTGKSGTRYEADLVIEATGRVPNLSVVEGGEGDVEHHEGGIVVDGSLRSVSNPAVHAIGDCVAGSPMLAPVADAQGKLVARNILSGSDEEFDASVIPSAAFTTPSIGSVGLTEEQAKEQGLDVRVNRGSTTGWPSAKRIGEKHGGYKVIIENGSERIVGAHLARHNAAEAINVLALAMKHGITAPQLKDFMWAYPTIVSDLKYMVG